MERLDALCVRETNGKSYFSRIGVAFPNKDGKGWSVLLDAMPTPTEGQYKIMLREPLPKDGQRQQSGGNSGGYADDTDTPF
jgi:hypothetical protein